MAETVSSISLVAINRYIMTTLIGNLIWESAQLPLYRIWYHAGMGRLALIVCLGVAGDIAIAIVALILGICLCGADGWPKRRFWPVAGFVMAFGLCYTLGSEYIHLQRDTWHYAAIMPRIPQLGIGFAPVLEWLVIPCLALILSRQNRSDTSDR